MRPPPREEGRIITVRQTSKFLMHFNSKLHSICHIWARQSHTTSLTVTASEFTCCALHTLKVFYNYFFTILHNASRSLSAITEFLLVSVTICDQNYCNSLYLLAVVWYVCLYNAAFYAAKSNKPFYPFFRSTFLIHQAYTWRGFSATAVFVNG